MRLRSKTTISLVLSAMAIPAFGENPTMVFEQKLDHPYSQIWYSKHLSDLHSNTHEIYIKGEGKTGSFFGVLYLDCNQPRYSRWEAQGGMLTDKDVPAQVIAAVRSDSCPK